MVRERVSKCCHASVKTYEGCDSEDMDFCPECKETGCGYTVVCVECDEEPDENDNCNCRTPEELAEMQRMYQIYRGEITAGIHVPNLTNF